MALRLFFVRPLDDLQACRNLGISHDGIRHEYVMEYAMMELQQWAEIDRLGALRGL